MQSVIQAHINNAIDVLKQKNIYAEFVSQIHNISFSINMRKRTTAGVCFHHKLTKRIRLEFSHSVFSSIVSKSQYNTVVHELAHAIQFFYRHTSHHDSEFYSICDRMNGEASRCHSYNVKRNVVKRFKIIDNDTGRLHTCTTRTFNVIKNNPKYKLVSVRSYDGENMIKEEFVNA